MADYTLPELAYDYSALAPSISGAIMELHHSKHHQAYVTGANTALTPSRGDFSSLLTTTGRVRGCFPLLVEIGREVRVGARNAEV